MSAEAWLEDLWRRGGHVVAQGARLTVKAPAGVLTEADRAALRQHKPAILARLAPPPPRCWSCRTAHPAGWNPARAPCPICHPPPPPPADPAG